MDGGDAMLDVDRGRRVIGTDDPVGAVAASVISNPFIVVSGPSETVAVGLGVSGALRLR